jgi:hypothetical protein
VGTQRTGQIIAWTIATIVLFVAAAGAAWWLVGDLSTTSHPDPSRLFDPPKIDSATETIVGLLLTIAVVSYWTIFTVVTRRAGTFETWLPVPACLTAAGCFVGFSCRVLTAGVDGANIGGGFLVLIGPFVLLALLVFPVVYALNIAPKRSGSSRPGSSAA